MEKFHYAFLSSATPTTKYSMRLRYLLISLPISIFFLISCGRYTKQYTINDKILDSLVKSKDTTFVLCWTKWCGGSKQALLDYIQLDSFIRNNRPQLQTIFIAFDDNVSDSTISKQRELGLLSFRIDHAGTNAFMNRKSLKSFLKQTFEKKDFNSINGFFYPVPVELIVTKSFDVVEEGNTLPSLNTDMLFKGLS